MMTYDDTGMFDTAYTYGVERIGIDILDGTRPDAQNPLYYLYDGQGSVTYVTKPDGEKRDTYTYDEFGKPRTGKLSPDGDMILHTSFGYNGEQWDEESKLQYLRARYYEPETGRFLSRDSYEGDLQEPLSKQLYAYVQNNPVNKKDPSGHKMEPGSAEWFKHVKKDWTRDQVKDLQFFLNNKGFRDNKGKSLDPNGIYNDSTYQAHVKYFNSKKPKKSSKPPTKPKIHKPINRNQIFNPDPSINTTSCHIAATHNIQMNQVTIKKSNTAYQIGALGIAGGIVLAPVVASLPALAGSLAAAFAGKIQSVTLNPGQVFYRAEAAASKVPGQWFGTVAPKTAQEAEQLYNIVKWGNTMEQVGIYKVTEKVTVYFGRVAGGTGTQIYIPPNIPANTVLEKVGSYPLK